MKIIGTLNVNLMVYGLQCYLALTTGVVGLNQFHDSMWDLLRACPDSLAVERDVKVHFDFVHLLLLALEKSHCSIRTLLPLLRLCYPTY